MDIMLLSFLWLSTVAHRTQKSLIFACTVSRSLPVKVSCLSSTVFGRDYFLLLGFPWGYCPFGFCAVKNFIGIFCYVTWYVILKFLSLSVMIWNLRLDELLAEIEDGDLLEEKELDELDEVWCRRCFLLLWYLSFKLLLWGELDLIDDDELFLVYLHFSIFFYN